MTFEQFLKKNMKRISRLETELDKLFDGTKEHTSFEIQSSRYRMTTIDEKREIRAWVGFVENWYSLEDFANMTAMITQIKHDVKEARK